MYRTPIGPDSLLWRYAGDTRIAFVGGTIGLLQLMHPAIGAGVLEHSNFFEDPFDRVFRSLPPILGAVYDADPEATGRTIRDYHASIKGIDADGRRYHALDPATFWWAHATFQYMAEQVADRWDSHRLSGAEREQLYAEGVEWYRRYGVSDRCVPADRAAMQVEWDRVCAEVLEVNPAVEFVLRMLRSRRLGGMRDRAGIPGWMTWGPAGLVTARASYLAAIGSLPPIVRDRLGVRWTARDRLDFEVLQRSVQVGWRFVPEELAWQPRALAGWRRVRAGRELSASA